MNRRFAALLLAAAAGAALLLGPIGQSEPPADTVRSVLQERADNAGFARVQGPRPLNFPRDHGAHPEFRHEWWYLTGHLRTPEGGWRGFQLTFFRYAAGPVVPTSVSRWRTNQWVIAHFAVSDPDSRAFHAEARQSRAALDLAGYQQADAEVWLGDWRLARNPDDDSWQLSAANDTASLELRLVPEKPLVLQGEGGYSPKSDEPGNASHYYSLPRLTGAGELRVAGTSHPVTARAWLDHEWGTSGLGKEQAGWDWFALQLDDGRELTFYRLRRHDGSADPHSRGLLVAADGTARVLDEASVSMQPTRWWTSPKTGIRYPVSWRVEMPAERIALRLEPEFDAQEWTGELRYWEGAVAVGAAEDQTRVGRGYLEMTGYGPP